MNVAFVVAIRRLHGHGTFSLSEAHERAFLSTSGPIRNVTCGAGWSRPRRVVWSER